MDSGPSLASGKAGHPGKNHSDIQGKGQMQEKKGKSEKEFGHKNKNKGKRHIKEKGDIWERQEVGKIRGNGKSSKTENPGKPGHWEMWGMNF